MEVGKLNVEFRGETGKSAVRRLRTAGKIPAICYGGGERADAAGGRSDALLKSLDPVKKTNTVLDADGGRRPDGDERR